MAKIGDQLLQPETGWKRYDDINSNIGYVNMQLNDRPYGYNGTVHFTTKIGNNISVNFNIVSNKIRVITPLTHDSSNIDIYIDGIKEKTVNQQIAGNVMSQILIFEKYFVDTCEHYISIKNSSNDGKYSYFDAIDINESGMLKPYNENLPKYLIKQNNQYYTLKSNYYSNGCFIPVTLTSGTRPNKEDYNTYGFNNLYVLTENTTINSETFRPIDKLQKQFDNIEILRMVEK